MPNRLAYLRLTGIPLIERRPTTLRFPTPDGTQESVRRNVGFGRCLILVPTGDVIWDPSTDYPVEVWVPIDRLAEWRANTTPGDPTP